MPWYANLLAVLAVFVVPIVLGYYLSRLWQMPDYFGKIALVLFTTLAGVVISVFGWPPKLGIDLRGGVILVYEIQESGLEKVKQATEGAPAAKRQRGAGGQETVDMDKLAAAIGKRINPGGVREITIRPYGGRQIEIIVPEADEAEARHMKAVISRIGTLEFRILATTNRATYRSYIDRARKMPDYQMELKDEEGNLLAWWVPVAKESQKEFNYPDIATRKVKRGGQEQLEVLVVNDRYNVNGDYLTRAVVGESTGRPCVNFTFNGAGARLFGGLTGDHRPDDMQNVRYYLGIILDGKLHSAPYIKTTIFEHGQITVDSSKPIDDQNREAKELVDVLNAGSLPTALSTDPISEVFTGPTLGPDTIRMGRDSMVLSMILVCAFMLVYYRFSGIVATLALAANMVLLLACMIAIKAAFSLPGLAGFALTIGMAVDSNVLIYERIREEMDRGAALRMAIRNGFDRAFSAIFDSHLTTLISAAVLYVIGQEQVKGFAITLFLGVAINLYTAVFCVHVVFDVAERQKWITRLKMMRMLTKTNIDFWGLRYRCYCASLVIILVGLVGVFARGRGLLNIDFTGGVSVQVEFNEPQRIAHIREKLADLPDLVVSDVRVQGEEAGRRFVINTSSPPGVEAAAYLKQVQDEIRDRFPGQLTANSLEVSDVEAIGGTTKPGGPPGKGPSPPAGKGEPPPKAQSRRELPSGTLLASADPASTLLALAEPAAKAPAPPAPPVAPAAKPAAKTQAAKEPAAKQSAAKPSGEPERFAGGTQATLKFAHAVRYDALKQMIQAELEARGQSPSTVDLDLTSKDYHEGDTTAYDTWTVRTSLAKDKAQPLFAALQQQLRNSPYFPSSNTIGGSVAGSTRHQAVLAVIVSNFLIMLYLWVRFQRLSYGVAAVVALIHDVLVALGFLAISAYIAPFFNAINLRFLLLEPVKIGMTEVAAFLTIVGYSVSDTVVVFDRIREVRGKSPDVTPQIINTSINQTLSRTILTSLTAWLVVVVLYFLGGPTIHGFAFAMIIGVVTGTYSSIYIAAPLLLVGKKHAAVPMESERRGPSSR
jgi:SecD/SecF fusion protein